MFEMWRVARPQRFNYTRNDNETRCSCRNPFTAIARTTDESIAAAFDPKSPSVSIGGTRNRIKMSKIIEISLRLQLIMCAKLKSAPRTAECDKSINFARRILRHAFRRRRTGDQCPLWSITWHVARRVGVARTKPAKQSIRIDALFICATMECMLILM